ncbi:hypothetical protein ACFL42_03735, partial [Candidatus Omnitrophota bacterium]
ISSAAQDEDRTALLQEADSAISAGDLDEAKRLLIRVTDSHWYRSKNEEDLVRQIDTYCRQHGWIMMADIARLQKPLQIAIKNHGNLGPTKVKLDKKPLSTAANDPEWVELLNHAEAAYYSGDYNRARSTLSKVEGHHWWRARRQDEIRAIVDQYCVEKGWITLAEISRVEERLKEVEERKADSRALSELYENGELKAAGSREILDKYGIDASGMRSALDGVAVEHMRKNYGGLMGAQKIARGNQTDVYAKEGWDCVIKRPINPLVMMVRLLSTLLRFLRRDHKAEPSTPKPYSKIKGAVIIIAAAIVNILVRANVSTEAVRERLGGLVSPFAADKKRMWQERAVDIRERISSAYAAGRIPEAKELIRKFAELNCAMWKRGVFVTDLLFKNTGVDEEGEVMLLDTGRCLAERPADWRIKLYLAFMRVQNVSFLSQLDDELVQYYLDTTDALWTTDSVKSSWSTEEPRRVAYVIDETLRGKISEFTEGVIERDGQLPVPPKSGIGRLLPGKFSWSSFETWFFKDVEAAYRNGIMDDEEYKALIALKSSRAMKVYALTYTTYMSLKVLMWAARIALFAILGISGNLSVLSGILAYVLPMIACRVGPVIYFRIKNPEVKFGLAIFLGFMPVPGIGSFIIPAQAVIAFRKVLSFRIRSRTSTSERRDEESPGDGAAPKASRRRRSPAGESFRGRFEQYKKWIEECEASDEINPADLIRNIRANASLPGEKRLLFHLGARYPYKKYTDTVNEFREAPPGMISLTLDECTVEQGAVRYPSDKSTWLPVYEVEINGRRFLVGGWWYIKITLKNGEMIYWAGPHNYAYSFCFDAYRDEVPEIIAAGGKTYYQADEHFDFGKIDEDCEAPAPDADWEAHFDHGTRDLGIENFATQLANTGFAGRMVFAKRLEDASGAVFLDHDKAALEIMSVIDIENESDVDGIFSLDADLIVGWNSALPYEAVLELGRVFMPHLLNAMRRSPLNIVITTGLIKPNGMPAFIDPDAAHVFTAQLIEKLALIKNARTPAALKERSDPDLDYVAEKMEVETRLARKRKSPSGQEGEAAEGAAFTLTDENADMLAEGAVALAKFIKEGRFKATIMSGKSHIVTRRPFEAAWKKLYPGEAIPPLYFFKPGRENDVWYKDPFVDDRAKKLAEIVRTKTPVNSESGLTLESLKDERLCILDDTVDRGGKLTHAPSILRQIGFRHVWFASYAIYHPVWLRDTAVAGLVDPAIQAVVSDLRYAAKRGDSSLEGDLRKIEETIRRLPPERIKSISIQTKKSQRSPDSEMSEKKRRSPSGRDPETLTDGVLNSGELAELKRRTEAIAEEFRIDENLLERVARMVNLGFIPDTNPDTGEPYKPSDFYEELDREVTPPSLDMDADIETLHGQIAQFLEPVPGAETTNIDTVIQVLVHNTQFLPPHLQLAPERWIRELTGIFIHHLHDLLARKTGAVSVFKGPSSFVSAHPGIDSSHDCSAEVALRLWGEFIPFKTASELFLHATQSRGYRPIDNGAKPGDIIVYFDKKEADIPPDEAPEGKGRVLNLIPEHVGIVTKVDSRGEPIEVWSKFGKGGIFLHTPNLTGRYHERRFILTNPAYREAEPLKKAELVDAQGEASSGQDLDTLRARRLALYEIMRVSVMTTSVGDLSKVIDMTKSLSVKLIGGIRQSGEADPSVAGELEDTLQALQEIFALILPSTSLIGLSEMAKMESDRAVLGGASHIFELFMSAFSSLLLDKTGALRAAVADGLGADEITAATKALLIAFVYPRLTNKITLSRSPQTGEKFDFSDSFDPRFTIFDRFRFLDEEIRRLGDGTEEPIRHTPRLRRSPAGVEVIAHLDAAEKLTEKSREIIPRVLEGERMATLNIHNDIIDHLSKRDREKIIRVITSNYALRENERSEYVGLDDPIYEIGGNTLYYPIEQLQIKGVVFDADEKIGIHDGIGKMAYDKSVDRKGFFYKKTPMGKPQGACTLDRAVNEFVKTHDVRNDPRINTNVIAKYPVGWGEIFPKKPFRNKLGEEKRLGFVLLGGTERYFVRGQSNNRRNLGMLRTLHDNQYAFEGCHQDNVSAFTDGERVYIHDLDILLNWRDAMTKEEFLAHQLYDMYYAFEKEADLQDSVYGFNSGVRLGDYSMILNYMFGEEELPEATELRYVYLDALDMFLDAGADRPICEMDYPLIDALKGCMERAGVADWGLGGFVGTGLLPLPSFNEALSAERIAKKTIDRRSPSGKKKAEKTLFPLTPEYIKSSHPKIKHNSVVETREIYSVMSEAMLDEYYHAFEYEFQFEMMADGLKRNTPNAESDTFTFGKTSITFVRSKDNETSGALIISDGTHCVGHAVMDYFPEDNCVGFRYIIHDGSQAKTNPDYRGRGHGSDSLVLIMSMCVNGNIFGGASIDGFSLMEASDEEAPGIQELYDLVRAAGFVKTEKYKYYFDMKGASGNESTLRVKKARPKSGRISQAKRRRSPSGDARAIATGYEKIPNVKKDSFPDAGLSYKVRIRNDVDGIPAVNVALKTHIAGKEGAIGLVEFDVYPDGHINITDYFPAGKLSEGAEANMGKGISQSFLYWLSRLSQAVGTERIDARTVHIYNHHVFGKFFADTIKVEGKPFDLNEQTMRRLYDFQASGARTSITGISEGYPIDLLKLKYMEGSENRYTVLESALGEFAGIEEIFIDKGFAYRSDTGDLLGLASPFSMNCIFSGAPKIPDDIIRHDLQLKPVPAIRRGLEEISEAPRGKKRRSPSGDRREDVAGREDAQDEPAYEPTFHELNDIRAQTVRYIVTFFNEGATKPLKKLLATSQTLLRGGLPAEEERKLQETWKSQHEDVSELFTHGYVTKIVQGLGISYADMMLEDHVKRARAEAALCTRNSLNHGLRHHIGLFSIEPSRNNLEWLCEHIPILMDELLDLATTIDFNPLLTNDPLYTELITKPEEFSEMPIQYFFGTAYSTKGFIDRMRSFLEDDSQAAVSNMALLTFRLPFELVMLEQAASNLLRALDAHEKALSAPDGNKEWLAEVRELRTITGEFIRDYGYRNSSIRSILLEQAGLLVPWESIHQIFDDKFISIAYSAAMRELDRKAVPGEIILVQIGMLIWLGRILKHKNKFDMLGAAQERLVALDPESERRVEPLPDNMAELRSSVSALLDDYRNRLMETTSYITQKARQEGTFIASENRAESDRTERAKKRRSPAGTVPDITEAFKKHFVRVPSGIFHKNGRLYTLTAQYYYTADETIELDNGTVLAPGKNYIVKAAFTDETEKDVYIAPQARILNQMNPDNDDPFLPQLIGTVEVGETGLAAFDIDGTHCRGTAVVYEYITGAASLWDYVILYLSDTPSSFGRPLDERIGHFFEMALFMITQYRDTFGGKWVHGDIKGEQFLIVHDQKGAIKRLSLLDHDSTSPVDSRGEDPEIMNHRKAVHTKFNCSDDREKRRLSDNTDERCLPRDDLHAICLTLYYIALRMKAEDSEALRRAKEILNRYKISTERAYSPDELIRELREAGAPYIREEAPADDTQKSERHRRSPSGLSRGGEDIPTFYDLNYIREQTVRFIMAFFLGEVRDSILRLLDTSKALLRGGHSAEEEDRLKKSWHAAYEDIDRKFSHGFITGEIVNKMGFTYADMTSEDPVKAARAEAALCLRNTLKHSLRHRFTFPFRGSDPDAKCLRYLSKQIPILIGELRRLYHCNNFMPHMFADPFYVEMQTQSEEANDAPLQMFFWAARRTQIFLDTLEPMIWYKTDSQSTASRLAVFTLEFPFELLRTEKAAEDLLAALAKSKAEHAAPDGNDHWLDEIAEFRKMLEEYHRDYGYRNSSIRAMLLEYTRLLPPWKPGTYPIRDVHATRMFDEVIGAMDGFDPAAIPQDFVETVTIFKISLLRLLCRRLKECGKFDMLKEAQERLAALDPDSTEYIEPVPDNIADLRNDTVALLEDYRKKLEEIRGYIRAQCGQEGTFIAHLNRAESDRTERAKKRKSPSGAAGRPESWSGKAAAIASHAILLGVPLFLAPNAAKAAEQIIKIPQAALEMPAQSEEKPVPTKEPASADPEDLPESIPIPVTESPVPLSKFLEEGLPEESVKEDGWRAADPVEPLEEPEKPDEEKPAPVDEKQEEPEEAEPETPRGKLWNMPPIEAPDDLPPAFGDFEPLDDLDIADDYKVRIPDEDEPERPMPQRRSEPKEDEEDPLARLLKDIGPENETDVRVDAARRLSFIGRGVLGTKKQEEVRSALEKAAVDSDAAVRNAAERAIEEIDHPVWTTLKWFFTEYPAMLRIYLAMDLALMFFIGKLFWKVHKSSRPIKDPAPGGEPIGQPPLYPRLTPSHEKGRRRSPSGIAPIFMPPQSTFLTSVHHELNYFYLPRIMTEKGIQYRGGIIVTSGYPSLNKKTLSGLSVRAVNALGGWIPDDEFADVPTDNAHIIFDGLEYRACMGASLETFLKWQGRNRISASYHYVGDQIFDHRYEPSSALFASFNPNNIDLISEEYRRVRLVEKDFGPDFDINAYLNGKLLKRMPSKTKEPHKEALDVNIFYWTTIDEFLAGITQDDVGIAPGGEPIGQPPLYPRLTPSHEKGRRRSPSGEGSPRLSFSENDLTAVRDYLLAKGNDPKDVGKFLKALLHQKTIILEFACGEAEAAYALAENNDIFVLATDIFTSNKWTSTYNAYARDFRNRKLPGQENNEYEKPPLENLSVMRAEADILEVLPPDTIDCILFLNATYDAEKALAGMLKEDRYMRVLKRGGVAAGLTFFQQYDFEKRFRSALPCMIKYPTLCGIKLSKLVSFASSDDRIAI